MSDDALIFAYNAKIALLKEHNKRLSVILRALCIDVLTQCSITPAAKKVLEKTITYLDTLEGHN